MDNPADVQNDLAFLLGADNVLSETAGETHSPAVSVTAAPAGKFV